MDMYYVFLMVVTVLAHALLLRHYCAKIKKQNEVKAEAAAPVESGMRLFVFDKFVGLMSNPKVVAGDYDPSSHLTLAVQSKRLTILLQQLNAPHDDKNTIAITTCPRNAMDVCVTRNGYVTNYILSENQYDTLLGMPNIIEYLKTFNHEVKSL